VKVSLRRLTRDQWFWYVGLPLGSFAALLVEGLLIAGGEFFIEIAIPTAIGSMVALPLGGYWITHVGKPVSKRATNLSLLALLASILPEAVRYALAIDHGISYYILEASSLVFFVPGFLCGFHYIGIGTGEPQRGQKIIIDGWLFLIYVGFGSYSVRNIASDIFHANLLPSQAWPWLGRAGFEGAPLLMAIGILITTRNKPLTVTENPAARKETWGEWLQGLTFLLTLIGVSLSAYRILVLGGFIAITAGLLCYPIGWLVTRLSRRRTLKTSGND